ncbi:UDP-galactose/UDP-glucose transporter 7 isoform X1 [Nematostella vectensis]|uniref:UDP-galactose/UDP-glucose transporter 7 isoform X1 n=1 Tax=Nematostella vectensis TaxID=45351 RepID=UPI002077417A|nr:UDP-galactose/UDP-glucose transporter 7 isoform X1 [Nematostella vectensis]
MTRFTGKEENSINAASVKEEHVYDTSLAEDLGFKKAFAPGILAALFYGLTSGSMSFLNKILLTSYSFHFPNILMLMQVTVTAAGLEILRAKEITDIPKYTLERAMTFLIPSVCFALQTSLALRALSILSIPMYNTLRRLLPLVTLLFTRLVLKASPSKVIIASVILVVMGCIIAGLGDLHFSSDAYICALGSVLSQSFYLTYIQKTGAEKGLSALAVLHLNSINCIPILMAYVVLSHEIMDVYHYTQYKNNGFEVMIVIDVLMGCVLNYSLFLCATANSALTTSLVGVVKGVLTTFIGFFTFGGVPATFLTVSGVVLNTLGGVLYSYGKYMEKVKKEVEKHFHEHTEIIEVVSSETGDQLPDKKTLKAVDTEK